MKTCTKLMNYSKLNTSNLSIANSISTCKYSRYHREYTNIQSEWIILTSTVYNEQWLFCLFNHPVICEFCSDQTVVSVSTLIQIKI